MPPEGLRPKTVRQGDRAVVLSDSDTKDAAMHGEIMRGCTRSVYQ